MNRKPFAGLTLLCLLIVLLLSGCGDSRELIIGDDATAIAPGAFRGRSFETVTIPDTVTRIGASAFENCKNLKTVVIPPSVASIGNGAFRNCSSLTSVILPEGLLEIKISAFENCKNLTAVIIPSSVTQVGEYAFSNCSSLADITLNGETNIISNAFEGCAAVRSLTIRGDALGGHPAYAIQSSKVPVTLTLPDSIVSIGNQAFSSCRTLSQVILPDTVTAIGDKAFARCSALQEINIPDSVTRMADNAFESTPLVKDALELVPGDLSAAPDLSVPLAELTRGKRILPVRNETLYGSLYALMPAALRTCSSREADFVLAAVISYRERSDFSGPAYDTCTGIYLCAKDGTLCHICDIWHAPSVFGIVKAGGALRGDAASPVEIWEAIEKMMTSP